MPDNNHFRSMDWKVGEHPDHPNGYISIYEVLVDIRDQLDDLIELHESRPRRNLDEVVGFSLLGAIVVALLFWVF